MRIDILTSVTGVTFDQAWQGRMQIAVGSLQVACLGRAELLKNKRAVGREKDLLDIHEIERNG